MYFCTFPITLGRREFKMSELFRKIFKKMRDEFFTIPNLLSILRLLLIPVLVWLYCFKHDNIATCILLVFSVATDIVDGFIARHFNMITDFGKFLDPVADKATQLAVIICLITRFHAMAIPAVVLVLKELSAFLIRLKVFKETEIVDGAKWHGKAATGIIVATVLLHLLWNDIPSPISLGVICFTTAFMIFSAVMYTVECFNTLKKYGKK